MASVVKAARAPENRSWSCSHGQGPSAPSGCSLQGQAAQESWPGRGGCPQSQPRALARGRENPQLHPPSPFSPSVCIRPPTIHELTRPRTCLVDVGISFEASCWRQQQFMPLYLLLNCLEDFILLSPRYTPLRSARLP